MIPYTDHECRLVLDELGRGEKVIRPSSIEHAEFMIKVAQDYINDQHNKTLNALKADYDLTKR
jgi:hypothetical protein